MHRILLFVDNFFDIIGEFIYEFGGDDESVLVADVAKYSCFVSL